MEILKYTLISTLLLGTTLQANAQLKREIVDEVIAIVGSKIILRSQLEAEYHQAAMQYGKTQQVKCMVFDKLLSNQLLLVQAELDSMEVSEEQVNGELDNKIRYYANQVGGERKLVKFLGKSIEEYRDQMRPKIEDNLLVRQMEASIKGNVKVSPKDVEKYYKTFAKDSLPMIKAQIQVAHIVMKPKVSDFAKKYAKKQITRLRERIMAGESFSTLAMAWSEDPGSKQEGGALPEFGRGDMVPSFERVAFTLKKDSISEVFESKFGFHFMKLISRKGDRVNARHILIKAKNTSGDIATVTDTLKNIKFRLEHKMLNLCDAARQYSSDKGTKGTCGYFLSQQTGNRTLLVEQLDRQTAMQTQALKVGTWSDPLPYYNRQGEQGYRLLFIKNKIEPHRANLKQDYTFIMLVATEDKKQENLNNWIKKQVSQTYIKINATDLNCKELDKWKKSN